VSKKSGRIAALIESCRGKSWDAHYLGYFECFNRGLYYEAHDVLEELWLIDRSSPNYSFHKGLIQLAGAFVHLQKDRLRPSGALFDLARNNLMQYPARHEGLDLPEVLALISEWRSELTNGRGENPIKKRPAPQLAVPDESQN
jgi:predicted metal-dependent hydrolase